MSYPPGRVTRKVTFTVDTPDSVSDRELVSRFASMYADGPVLPGWWVSLPEVTGPPPPAHLSDDDSEAEAAASEQLAQFREGDVLPSWGDRPLTAREAAALNERPDDVAARGDLRKLARTDHAAFLATLDLRVDDWIALMGSRTPEGDAELTRFVHAVFREDDVDPGQIVPRLRRARQRYRNDPGFRAYVNEVAAEWEPPAPDIRGNDIAAATGDPEARP